mmetsp:Transcript_78075/g.208732  ORF Transcript_78075/g.208732 Transcript_78075/m.208732 type:complete len:255 (-) Transcript_78075:1464-2228(-)
MNFRNTNPRGHRDCSWRSGEPIVHQCGPQDRNSQQLLIQLPPRHLPFLSFVSVAGHARHELEQPLKTAGPRGQPPRTVGRSPDATCGSGYPVAASPARRACRASPATMERFRWVPLTHCSRAGTNMSTLNSGRILCCSCGRHSQMLCFRLVWWGKWSTSNAAFTNGNISTTSARCSSTAQGAISVSRRIAPSQASHGCCGRSTLQFMHPPPPACFFLCVFGARDPQLYIVWLIGSGTFHCSPLRTGTENGPLGV